MRGCYDVEVEEIFCDRECFEEEKYFIWKTEKEEMILFIKQDILEEIFSYWLSVCFLFIEINKYQEKGENF